MSAAVAVKTGMSQQEYLAFERSSEQRHEFVEGEIFAMAGCTDAHDTIVGNVFAALHASLRGTPCKPFTPDMKVHILMTGGFKYPDASIACRPKFLDDTKDVLLNPCVIVEVLSDSTEAYDRGKKFLYYRSIPSLMDYVLVSQKEALVEHYAKQPDGRWLIQEVQRAGGTLRLSAVPVEIPINLLYERIEFSAL